MDRVPWWLVESKGLAKGLPQYTSSGIDRRVCVSRYGSQGWRGKVNGDENVVTSHRFNLHEGNGTCERGATNLCFNTNPLQGCVC